MTKLQDFARLQGVTERQVQRLIKKYAAELEGMVERRGHNGTWLSEEACDILRGKMKTPPAPVVFEEDPRVSKMEERIAELERRLDEKDKMLTMAQQSLQTAQERVAELLEDSRKVLLLEESNKGLEAKIERMMNATLWERLRGFKK